MKKTSAYNHRNCSIQEQSINAILDSGLNRLSYNSNHNPINNPTYTMNHDMNKHQQYDSNEMIRESNNKTYTTCPEGRQAEKSDDDSMVYLIEYRQKLACRDNELHTAKMDLNNQLHINTELREHLCQSEALIKEKECVILNQCKDIEELHGYKEDYCKLRCDYDHLIEEYENSERIRNEQKMLIIALQRDIDLMRQKSFNTISEIQYQQDSIAKDKIRLKIDEMIQLKEKELKKSKSINLSKSPNRSMTKTINQSPSRTINNNYSSTMKNTTSIKSNGKSTSRIQSSTSRLKKHKMNTDLPKKKTKTKQQYQQLPSYMK